MSNLLFSEAEWDFATLDRTLKAIEEIALKAKDAVGAMLAGIDLMETDDGYSVIEVNTGAEFNDAIPCASRGRVSEQPTSVVDTPGPARPVA